MEHARDGHSTGEVEEAIGGKYCDALPGRMRLGSREDIVRGNVAVLSRIVSIVQRDEGDRWPEAELIYYKCRGAQTRTEGIIILCRSLYIHMV
jgi:hypothetical protein